ncbi:MAG TPA: hypothetical protein VHU83_16745 [Bryobacteraceae bacterium]|jgi:hypothetical protein|nr:hypothetical protein [Bryobacteraceae bacterium]
MSRTRNLALWTGVLAGPFVWLLSFQANFTLAPWACEFNTKIALFLVTLVALVLVAGSGWLAWREWTELGKALPDNAAGALGRSRIMALGGVLLSAMFFVVILAQAMPELILGACE